MTERFADMAQRIENAYRGFELSLVELAKITPEEAAEVTKIYLKIKAAKLQPNIGRIDVKHGAFLDKAVIRRTAKTGSPYIA